jgi:hypothetical protein
MARPTHNPPYILARRIGQIMISIHPHPLNYHRSKYNIVENSLKDTNNQL